MGVPFTECKESLLEIEMGDDTPTSESESIASYAQIAIARYNYIDIDRDLACA